MNVFDELLKKAPLDPESCGLAAIILQRAKGCTFAVAVEVAKRGTSVNDSADALEKFEEMVARHAGRLGISFAKAIIEVGETEEGAALYHRYSKRFGDVETAKRDQTSDRAVVTRAWEKLRQAGPSTDPLVDSIRKAEANAVYDLLEAPAEASLSTAARGALIDIARKMYGDLAPDLGEQAAAEDMKTLASLAKSDVEMMPDFAKRAPDLAKSVDAFWSRTMGGSNKERLEAARASAEAFELATKQFNAEVAAIADHDKCSLGMAEIRFRRTDRGQALIAERDTALRAIEGDESSLAKFVIKDGDGDPNAKLDELAKRHAQAHKVPYGKAYLAICETDAGKALYQRATKVQP